MNFSDTHPDRKPFENVVDEEGNAIHSWRMNVAPYIYYNWFELAEDEQYRFDEPWNNEHNLAFAEQELDALICPNERYEDNINKDIKGHKIGRSSYVKVTGIEHLLPEGGVLIIEVPLEDTPAWSEPVDISLEELLARGVKPLHSYPKCAMGLVWSPDQIYKANNYDETLRDSNSKIIRLPAGPITAAELRKIIESN